MRLGETAHGWETIVPMLVSGPSDAAAERLAQQDAMGRCLLHWGCMICPRGFDAVVALATPAALAQVTSRGDTPLHWLLAADIVLDAPRRDVALQLVALGAPTDAANGAGATPQSLLRRRVRNGTADASLAGAVLAAMEARVVASGATAGTDTVAAAGAPAAAAVLPAVTAAAAPGRASLVSFAAPAAASAAAATPTAPATEAAGAAAAAPAAGAAPGARKKLVISLKPAATAARPA